MYSCRFLISSASVLYCAHLCMKCSLGISNFLEEISSLSHFNCFALFLCTVHLGRLSYLSLLFSGTLHSLGWSFPFLPCFSLLFFPQLFVKSPQKTTLPSCISFSLGWFCSLPPIQCYELSPIVLQALCLSDLIPWICHFHCIINHKGFDLGHT